MEITFLQPRHDGLALVAQLQIDPGPAGFDRFAVKMVFDLSPQPVKILAAFAQVLFVAQSRTDPHTDKFGAQLDADLLIAARDMARLGGKDQAPLPVAPLKMGFRRQHIFAANAVVLYQLIIIRHHPGENIQRLLQRPSLPVKHKKNRIGTAAPDRLRREKAHRLMHKSQRLAQMLADKAHIIIFGFGQQKFQLT